MIWGISVVAILVALFAFDGEPVSVKEKVVAAVGPFAKEIDYIKEDRFEAHRDELLGILQDDETYGQTEREKSSSEYRTQKLRYLAFGFKAILSGNKNRTEPSTNSTTRFSRTAFVGPEIPQYLGLIAFKRNELPQICKRAIDFALKHRLAGLAFFYPVHFSGGNGGDYKMPAKPEYGKHYRYERANMFSTADFNDCLMKIALSDLQLSFVPHLESISTINSRDHREWRLRSGIPINDIYLKHTFGDFLDFLKKNPQLLRKKKQLKITFAAEIDPIVFSNAAESLASLNQLKQDLKNLGLGDSELILNTNGDFLNGWEIPQAQNKWDCSAVQSLLDSFSIIAPSMYGNHGHLRMDNDQKLNLKQTVLSFQSLLQRKLAEHCDSIRTEHLQFAFGELAIDSSDERQSYIDLLARPALKVAFVQFWSTGKWDHIGLGGVKNKKLQEQIFSLTPPDTN